MRIRIWISIWGERGWLSVWDKVMWHHRLKIPELILAQCLRTTLQRVQVALEKLPRSLLSSALCKRFFRSGLLGAAFLLLYSISLDFAFLHFLPKLLPVCWVIRKNKRCNKPWPFRKKRTNIFVWHKCLEKHPWNTTQLNSSAPKQCKLKPLTNTWS